jgi:hypothetical protein
MCRGREAVTAVQAAVLVLEALGPSAELARAYATFANQRMLYADYGAATRLALRAQALAALFGATDVRSDALNTQAVSAAAKDLDWAGQMRHALSIALSGHHQDQTARAYSNLCGIHADKREFAEAERHRTGSTRPGPGDVAEPYRLLLGGDPVPAGQLWTRLRCPYDAAMALLTAPDEAALREALSILSGLGARPAALIAEQRLRALRIGVGAVDMGASPGMQ